MIKIENVKSAKRLSPELAEVLNMLKALEQQQTVPSVKSQ
jgi:hypothetical protein